MGACGTFTLAATAAADGTVSFMMKTFENSACKGLAIKKVDILGTPKLEIYAEEGAEVCAGEQITLKSKADYNASYKWEANDGTGWTTVGISKAQLYETKAQKTYQFRLTITPLPSGTPIVSSALSVNAITCCVVNGAPASRQTVYADDFGQVDMSDATGKTYIVTDYTDILNPAKVSKTTTTPFRYQLTPAPIGAVYHV